MSICCKAIGTDVLFWIAISINGTAVTCFLFVNIGTLIFNRFENGRGNKITMHHSADCLLVSHKAEGLHKNHKTFWYRLQVLQMTSVPFMICHTTRHFDSQVSTAG